MWPFNNVNSNYHCVRQCLRKAMKAKRRKKNCFKIVFLIAKSRFNKTEKTNMREIRLRCMNWDFFFKKNRLRCRRHQRRPRRWDRLAIIITMQRFDTISFLACLLCVCVCRSSFGTRCLMYDFVESGRKKNIENINIIEYAYALSWCHDCRLVASFV